MQRHTTQGEGPLFLLAPVQELIELPFFSDPEKARIALENPWALPEHEVALRSLHYLTGRELLRQPLPNLDRGDYVDPAVLTGIRRQYPDKIGEIRGALMDLDPGLEPRAVHTLRAALEQLEPAPSTWQPEPRTEKAPANPLEDLPDTEWPAQDVAAIIAVDSGTVVNYARRRHDTAPVIKRRLAPGRGQEVCVDIEIVRQLAEHPKYGLRPRVVEAGGIDWDRALPPETANLETLKQAGRYRRELQAKWIGPEKLPGRPDVADLPVAERWHVSRERFVELLGGGLAFIVNESHEAGIVFRAMRSRRPSGVGGSSGLYARLEQLAPIWEKYLSVPEATDAYRPVSKARQEAGIQLPGSFLAVLSQAEQARLIDMRAQESRRVTLHMPVELAKVAIGRARPIPLPPHLVALQHAPLLLDQTVRALNTRVNRQDEARVTRFRPNFNDKPLVFIDWPTLASLQTSRDGRDLRIAGAPVVDLDYLPRGPHEIDPKRIACAQGIQRWLFEQAGLPPAAMDEAVAYYRDAAPIVPPDRAILPIAPRIPIVAPRQPEVSMPELIPVQLSSELERPSRPQGLYLLRNVVPIGTTLVEAAEFAHKYGGLVASYETDEDALWTDDLGVELLRRQTNSFPPDAAWAPEGWLSRQQISERLDIAVDAVDDWLRGIDENQLRPHLATFEPEPGSRTGGTFAPLRRHMKLMVWCPTDLQNDPTVVPHYNPAVITLLTALASSGGGQALLTDS